MELKELKTKEEMLACLPILQTLYPTLTLDKYAEELDFMLQHNYGQVAVFLENHCIGLSGYWFGNKLWCGKYLEIDNIVIDPKHRSLGAGKAIVDFLKDKAISLDCNMVALDSYTSNFKAHKFFYNQGFEPKGFHFILTQHEENIR